MSIFDDSSGMNPLPYLQSEIGKNVAQIEEVRVISSEEAARLGICFHYPRDDSPEPIETRISGLCETWLARRLIQRSGGKDDEVVDPPCP